MEIKERLLVPGDWWEVADILGADGGVALIWGASDTGKTTLARFLTETLRGKGCRVALVDGDMGQATLGPPTTIGLAIHFPSSEAGEAPRIHLRFVGATSPSGHLLPTLVGLKRLVDKAFSLMAEVVLVDTTGLVQGGAARELKFRKVELLRPRHIVALQRASEIEHLLHPHVHRPGLKIQRLLATPEVKAKSREHRRAFREERFRHYFQDAALQDLAWRDVGLHGTWLGSGKRLSGSDLTFVAKSLDTLVFYGEKVGEELCLVTGGEHRGEEIHRLKAHYEVREVQIWEAGELQGLLLGLNDGEGDTMALGILQDLDLRAGRLTVLTPMKEPNQVKLIQFGSLKLEASGRELGALGKMGDQALKERFWAEKR